MRKMLVKIVTKHLLQEKSEKGKSSRTKLWLALAAIGAGVFVGATFIAGGFYWLNQKSKSDSSSSATPQ